MKTIIFYANPNRHGHCKAILTEVVNQLNKKSIHHIVIDLDKERYDPIMHEDELYTTGGTAVSTQTKKYQNLIINSDRLIFVYPIWWNTMPAMMKGFIDKVFAGRVAFKFVKHSILPFAIPVGLWTGKKASVFVTTGSRGWMGALFLGNRYKTIMKKDILGYCGIKAKVYALHNCLKYSDERKEEIQKLVEKGLRFL